SLTTNGSDCDDTMILYADIDGDGYGSGAPSSCGVANNSDCDDNNNSVYQSQTLYVDMDGDGFDGGTSTVCYGSEIPQGYSMTTNGSDCDDTMILYVDNDGDGFGTGAPTACGVANNTDCDDNNSGTHQSTVLYIDSDGDGYHGGVQLICFGEEIPDGYTLETLGLDCNDADVSVYQQHILYIDMDGDGFDSGTTNLCYGSDMPFGYSLTTSGYDCDDSNATVNPQAEEVMGNGIDENCSGMGDDVLTQVKATYCGSTVTDLYSPISAYPVANATAYRFAVTNTSSNTVQYVIRSTNWFSFIQLPAFAYGTTYSIAVELQLDGEWMGEFGQACNVSTFNLTEAGAIGI
ncbi:MAG: putative metal-binding motif-containing protein, partial [Proteiniphilum sp.]|nr:putative metal-binding motif-containing protein [Proteiniphilum sp.]